jgi:hypothetical protein
MKIIASLLMLAASTATADSLDPPAPDAAVKLAGHIVVWNDARFFLEADDNGPRLQAGVLQGLRNRNLGHVLPMRVLGTSGDFIEVEPVAGVDCTWTRLPQPEDLDKLRVFVKRSDIAPVVAKPFSKNYKDGTSVAVWPGLPVLPGGDTGLYRVTFGGKTLWAPVPSSSIGYSYAFGAPPVAKRGPDKFRIDDGTKVTLGERTFDLADMLTVPAVEKRGATSFVQLVSTCLKLRVAVPSKDVQESSFAGVGPGGGGRGLGYGERWVLPKGTPLYSPSMKRQVAVVASPIDVRKPEASATNACIVRPFVLDHPDYLAPQTDPPKPVQNLMVCAKLESVVHEPARP